MEQIILKIDGMACGMCEAHVNQAVRRLVPQAKKLNSSYKRGETSFVTDGQVDLDALGKAIGETGYRVLSAERRPYVKKGLFG